MQKMFYSVVFLKYAIFMLKHHILNERGLTQALNEDVLTK